MRHWTVSRRVAALAVALLALGSPCAAAQGDAPQSIDPQWLKVDSASKTVEFALLAGLTTLSSGLNFNGFKPGGLVLTVPQAWTIVLHFQNRDQALPHSAEVIPAGNIPTGPVKPAFEHAATHALDVGLAPGKLEDVRFVAATAGEYVIFCAVPGHGAAGMWIRLSITAGGQPGLATR